MSVATNHPIATATQFMITAIEVPTRNKVPLNDV
jgi:hypothetical protein